MTDQWSSVPPAAKGGPRGKYDWPEIVRKLKSRPGEWLLIDDEASRSLSSAIKARKMTALQDPDWTFDVQTRNNDREKNTAEVYMSARKRKAGI